MHSYENIYILKLTHTNINALREREVNVNLHMNTHDNTISLTLSECFKCSTYRQLFILSDSSCVKEEQVLGGSFFRLVTTNQNLTEISRMPVYET